MSVFDDYAQYYNLLYRDKDYAAEVVYIEQLLHQHSAKPVHSILDLGCGTGNHDFIFAQKGYDVTGVDLSEQMVAIATSRATDIPNVHFLCGNAQEIQIGKEFDAVISLFHVMSYQTSNSALSSCLKNAYTHLKQDGLFLFDFWYGPAVLVDPPTIRIKRLENDKIRVVRLAEPKMLPNENVVEVHYEIWVEEIQTPKVSENHQLKMIHEVHPMRYLFLPELKFMLEQIGFHVLQDLEWMSYKGLSADSWNGLLVAQK